MRSVYLNRVYNFQKNLSICQHTILWKGVHLGFLFSVKILPESRNHLIFFAGDQIKDSRPCQLTRRKNWDWPLCWWLWSSFFSSATFSRVRRSKKFFLLSNAHFNTYLFLSLIVIVNILEVFAIEINEVTETSNLLVTLNSSVNFFIYIFFGEKFKKQLCHCVRESSIASVLHSLTRR